ncbi:MAG: hypothetical protein ABW167_07800 [Baekduia sp.]
MARHKYVCKACGNEIEAVKIDKRIAGSKGMARIAVAPECECPDGGEMVREIYTPPRRDTSRHTGRL